MQSVLGKSVAYPSKPDASLLFRVPRKRSDVPALRGFDEWKCYEFSWLSELGIPRNGILWLRFSALSPFLVESKSLKLYLGGYFNTRFSCPEELQAQISADLGKLLGEAPQHIKIFLPQEWKAFECGSNYASLTPLEEQPELGTRTVKPTQHLIAQDKVVEERLVTNALRSLCPVTGQPDWASVEIHYRGRQLERASLLAWLMQRRDARGFHEEIADELAGEILRELKPQFLFVSCFFLRRGGIDITPVRCTEGYPVPAGPIRHLRQ